MSLFAWSVRFFLVHLPVIGGLSLIAAAGRAIQMGALGPLAPGTRLLLEIPVEGSRIAVLLYVLGHGSLTGGCRDVLGMFRRPGPQAEREPAAGVPSVPPRAGKLGLSLLLFALLAVAANLGATYVSRDPAVIATLRGAGLGLQGETLGEAVRFFVKNLTIIPFTIVFMVGLFRSLLTTSPRPVAVGPTAPPQTPPDAAGPPSSSATIPARS